MNSFNDPLLFINGPPVFHFYRAEQVEQVEQVEKIEQDESTSIYERPYIMSEKTVALLQKLYFLAKPFQRKVYRPLVFHLEDGVQIQGEIEKVDEEYVTFLIGTGEVITYRVDQVAKIFWRGSLMK